VPENMTPDANPLRRSHHSNLTGVNLGGVVVMELAQLTYKTSRDNKASLEFSQTRRTRKIETLTSAETVHDPLRQDEDTGLRYSQYLGTSRTAPWQT
jgi:hypothetical protein